MKKTVTVLSLVLLASACILGESTHHIYIDPTGSASWVVLERELRSDAGSAAERRDEEANLLSDVSLGLHPVARAFALLRPEGVDRQLLRSDRPFEVRTEARFHSVDGLVVDLLDRLGLTGSVRMWSEDRVTHLEVVIDQLSGDSGFEDDSILALVDDLSSYRLLVTEGRFVDAVGFDILEDGVVAIPVGWEDGVEDGGTQPVFLSLSWISDTSAGR